MHNTVLKIDFTSFIIFVGMVHCAQTVLNFYLLLGDLGKELKNLITLMDQEEQQALEKEQKTTAGTLNKESPVWFLPE